MLKAEIEQVHEIAKGVSQAGITAAMNVITAKIAEMLDLINQLESKVAKLADVRVTKKKTDE